MKQLLWDSLQRGAAVTRLPGGTFTTEHRQLRGGVPRVKHGTLLDLWNAARAGVGPK